MDFPFYNDIPKLEKWEWAVLVMKVLLFIFLTASPWLFEGYRFMAYFLVMIIPAIYVCKGDYGIFFKRLKRGDVKTIVLCFVGYMVYSFVVFGILMLLGHAPVQDAVLNSHSMLMYVVGLLFRLVGEEFFKVFMLLIVMYAVYGFTKNRNLAIRIGIIAALLIFGLAHMSSYGNLAQVILIQGLGSIFDLYAYMKTKNVIVSYLIHVMIDIFGSLSFLLGMS